MSWYQNLRNNAWGNSGRYNSGAFPYYQPDNNLKRLGFGNPANSLQQGFRNSGRQNQYHQHNQHYQNKVIIYYYNYPAQQWVGMYNYAPAYMTMYNQAYASSANNWQGPSVFTYMNVIEDDLQLMKKYDSADEKLKRTTEGEYCTFEYGCFAVNP